ncbi:MAG: sugar phosphate isomerase/epimerase [Victivallales bacterium]|nr:sugar phosphate isomerase/epimerase [Victivallales bacterium]
MFHVPLSFFYNFGALDEKMRRYIMAEFAANGAEHLVLTHDLINLVLKDVGMMDKLEKEMDDAGLSFVDSHAPFGQFMDLNVPEENYRRQMLLRHKLHINIAADMGVNTIAIHVGNEYYRPQIPLDKQIALICDALEDLLPVAEKRKVTICIENIWCRLNTPEVLLFIKEKFPSEALGFCFDAGHANNVDKGRHFERNSVFDSYVLTHTPAEYDAHVQEKMLPHIVNCHLHDNDGQYDTHINVGDGNTDWEKVIKLLRKAPRLKCIQSEVTPLDKCIPIRKLCDAFRRLEEIE